MGAREDLLAVPDELLRRGAIAEAALVFMDFRGAPKRWWAGFGDVEVAGNLWQGVGDLISISELSTSYQLSADEVTFAVAATQEMLALALDAKARVRDRAVTVYGQLFATEDVTLRGGGMVARGAPVGSPYAHFSGTMQRMHWSADGPVKRSVTIEAEGLFARRNMPPRGRWTDADQRARYGNDRGFERLPLYIGGYETRWRS